MRRDLAQVGKHRRPDHAGLAWNVWAPELIWDRERDPKASTEWIDTIADLAAPADYAVAYERWTRSFDGDIHARSFVLKNETPLLLGHGNAAPAEVGLTLQHTWGVPMIPGSALKGLCSAYLDIVYGPQARGEHPAVSDDIRARLQGPTFSPQGRTEHGPGDVYRTLFGSGAADSDGEMRDSGFAAIGETAGAVTFHDAWVVPQKQGYLRPDVLTVHQKAYYQNPTNNGPVDWDDPNPVSFLSVRPGLSFFFALSGPAEVTAFAERLLVEALCHWGIGGKTASGYGMFNRDSRSGQHDPVKAQSIVAANNSSTFQDFETWFSSQCTAVQRQELSQRQLLKAVIEDWKEKVASEEGIGTRAWELVSSFVSANKKTKEDLQQLQDSWSSA